MIRRKLGNRLLVKFIAVLITQSFVFTNVGWTAAALVTENSYLAPTVNIQTSSLSNSFSQAAQQKGLKNQDNVSSVTPLDTGLATKNHYLQELNKLKTESYIDSLSNGERRDIRFELTAQQETAYLNAIKDVLKERGEKVITPDILFEAAKIATENDRSTVKARIGLQPGTMNPLHYGHQSASLAGIIGRVRNTDKNVKVMTLLANGGTVPDKPFAASADIRNEMAREACKDPDFNEWAEVTPIRGQMVDMFTASPETTALAGPNENQRRFNMDMAAFIWLFVANPNVEWVYLVGSDKVAGYGKKNEKGLLVETLSRPEAHATVVYFSREGEEINYEKDIKPYEWLRKLWDQEFFVESTVSSFADLSATKVRTALVNGDNQIDGKPISETMSVGVYKYIRKNPTLLYLYGVEIKAASAKKLIAAGKLREGLALYAECINTVKAEIAKPEAEKVIDSEILDNLYLLILADEIKALTEQGALKGLSQLFLLYSAAPGTGKGELMDATFEKGKGKYANLIGKLILYHTRNPRVKNGKSEKDGIKYHFRSEKRLKELEAQGKIITAWVNRQLQGLSINDFIEEGIVVSGVSNANLLAVKDRVMAVKNDAKGNIISVTVQRGGEKKEIKGISISLDSMCDLLVGDIVTGINGENVTLSREIKGMSSVLEGGKPIILEGGYGWFASLVTQNPEIVSMFIAPFSDKDIGVRIKNTIWINNNFKKPEERLTAFHAVQRLIESSKGEIDLSINKGWREAVKKAVEGQRIAVYNAELIESEAFVQDINDLLSLFGKQSVGVKQEQLVRSLAYEVNRRIVAREGQLRYSRGKRPAFGEGETDPQFDRYNRVLEGVVQILYRHDYELNRPFGKIVFNPWGYTKVQFESILSKLTRDFTKFFFESILKGVRLQLVQKGHPIKAPPQSRDMLNRLVLLSDREIENMSEGELADTVRVLVESGALKSVPDLYQLFLIYSAAPGTGKGELMDATFEKGKGKYADLIGKLILYHTRNPRVKKGKSEKDGIKYHFRSEKRLKELEAQGKIVTAWVNRQLQGLAIKDFVEEGVLIEGVNGANQFQKGDVIKKIFRDKEANITEIMITRGGKDITIPGVTITLDSMYDLLEGDVVIGVEEDRLTINRQIKGMSSVFSEGQPVILEGGYDWFRALVEQYPDIISMFIAPFSDSDIQVREANTEWINDNFNGPAERLVAYLAMQSLIEENKGEVNLMQADSKGELWRSKVRETVDKGKIAKANAELIESDAFINDLNELLGLFNKPKLRKNQSVLARALAYEVSRRISNREGEVLFGRGKRPEYKEGETDPQHDRYNRVLEGVVQIILRHDYDRNRENNQLGRIVENPWGYTAEEKKQIITSLTNGFTRFFFETIVSQVTFKVNSESLREYEGMSEQLQLQAEAVERAI